MTASFDINQLTVAYYENQVLNQVTFQVKPGEFFIIIGPNGSGKSTLLRSMAGLVRPASGTVLLDGQPIQNYRRKSLARKIALVPQNMEVDFPFTCGQVVMMGRSPHQGLLGVERETDNQIVKAALDYSELTHLSDRKMSQLSGGERQRVFIAKAICQEPEAMFLDEPTAALDLAHQTRTMDMMARLKDEKKMTIVMVSHDINLAALYADTIMLLKNGEVLKMGPPDDVLTYSTLEKAYDCAILVDQNPLKPTPRITLVPESYLAKIRENR